TLVFVPVLIAWTFVPTKTSSSLSKEYLLLYPVPISIPLHYPRSICRALLQLQSLCIVANVALTKEQIPHPSGWWAHPTTEYQALATIIYKALLVCALHLIIHL